MKVKTMIAAGVAAFVWHAPASAQGSIDERFASMERRVKYLEERVADQDKVIVEKDREISKLSKQVEKQESSWFNAVEIAGAVEVETAVADPYEGDKETDATVATVELGIAARIHDWVGVDLVLLHEEDEDQDIAVDVATLTVGQADGPFSLTAGRQYVPFGVFESNSLSDPLTLELGETQETALRVGLSSEGLSGSVFGFNGDNDKNGRNRIAGYGAAIGYAMEREDFAFGTNLSYINDIGDSDSLQDAIAGTLGGNDVTDHVPGWAAGGMLRYGDASLIVEYLASLERFQVGEVAFAGHGAKPSSWMIEGAYGFGLAGKDATIAASYQGTREALALELPRKRVSISFSVAVLEQVAFGLEWARAHDYGVADRGSGREADTLTAQLAAEF